MNLSTSGTRLRRLLCVGGITFLTFACLISLNFGIDDQQLLQTFDADESWAVQRIQQNLEFNDLNPRGHYIYGYAYETLGVGILKIFKTLDYLVEPRLIATTLRLFSLATTALCFVIILQFMPLLGIPHYLFLPVVLLILSFPDFYYWTHHIHPDMLQLFFVLLAFYFALSQHSRRNAVIASFLVGAAFGTKYSGLVALPFVLLPYTFVSFATRRLKFTQQNILSVGASVACFAIAVASGYLLFNYHALLHPKEFLHSMLTLKLIVNAEHLSYISRNPLLWFVSFNRELGGVGTAVVVAGLLTFLAVCFRDLRDSSKNFRARLKDARFRNRVTCGLYAFVAATALMLTIKTRYSRYLYPVLPFIVLFALDGYDRLFSKLKPDAANFARLALICAIFLNLPHSMEMARSAASKGNHGLTAHTAWVNEHYCASTVLKVDDYTYAPAKFHRQMSIPRTSSIYYDVPSTELLILGSGDTGRFAWKSKGRPFADSPIETKLDIPAARNVAANLEKLKRADSPYKLVFENDHALVFEHRNLPSGKRTQCP